MSTLLSIIALIVAVIAYQRASRAEQAISGGKDLAPMSPHPITSTPVETTPILTPPRAGQNIQTPAGAVSPLPETPSATSTPSAGSRLLNWLSVDWPLKIGAFFLFLGIGWLVRFVFWEEIGPVGRTMIGIIIGLAILILGHLRLTRFPHQGTIIEGLGAGILSFTILVAHTEYALLPAPLALGFLFIVTVFVSFSSVVHKARSLALIALTLGAISPLLAGIDIDDFSSIFLYLFVLSVGSLWIVRLTGWRALIFASFLPYLLYSSAYIFGLDQVSQKEGILMVTLFAILYFVANIWAILKSEQPDKADLLTASANALLLTGWINVLADPEWKGLVTAATAIIFSLAAIVVYRFRGTGTAVHVYAAVAGLLLGIATVFEFSGPALIIAFTLEAGLLFTATLAFFGGVKAASSVAILFAVPITFSSSNFERYLSDHEVFTQDLAALLVLTVTLLICGWIKRQIESGLSSHPIASGLTLIGAVYALALVWFVLHNTSLSPDQATTITLVLYTVIGLGYYILGNIRQATGQKRFGLGLLIFVIGRLLMVDVWTMDTVARIITFIVVGLLLMSTAFIEKKKGF